MSAEAVYDCMKICACLDKPLVGVSKLEIQRYSFLACILSLFRARPVAEWGYKFARTRFGTPYSRELDQSIEILSNTGRFHVNEGRIHLTDAGREMFNLLARMENSKIRDPFLDAACLSALAVPPGIVMRGLDNEPTSQVAAIRPNGGALLEGPALQLLHEHFQGLSNVFPIADSDLVTPSVAWLSYVADEQFSKRTSAIEVVA